jgi:hypothetical protein
MKRTLKILAASVPLAAGLAVGSAGHAQAAPPTCTSWTTYTSFLGSSFVVHVPSAGFQSGRIDCMLWQGHANDAVTVLQRALRYCHGRNISIDGEYGPQTRSAVLWFQQHINDVTGGGALIEDGIYGPETKNWMSYPTWRRSDNTRTSNCEIAPVD